jgi:phosphoribosylformimino-5-aminoimidazole carboxamide ribotide isomerase
MEIIPSIDLRGDWVVKLTGGEKKTEWKISDDPVSIAQQWLGQGAKWIHLVDLDAAFGDGDNRRVMRDILKAAPKAKIQVSGGMRKSETIASWLERGAARVIAGTKAVQDREWLRQASKAFGKKLWVAVDSRGDEIVVRGWTEKAGLVLGEYVSDVDRAGFGGYLYTDVRVEGRHQGFDETAVARMVGLTKKPVVYSGGISSLEDLRRLSSLGVSGAILGAALYRGTFTLEQARGAVA